MRKPSFCFAIGESGWPSLYPLFVLSLDAGLRPSETRELRRANLHLVWRAGTIVDGENLVGRSKTDTGNGCLPRVTRRAGIARLQPAPDAEKSPNFDPRGAQDWAESHDSSKPVFT